MLQLSANLKRAAGQAAINIFLAICSTAVCLLLLEFAASAFIDRVDYLNPSIVAHDKLGHRIAGGTAGHDSRGFRNAREMPNADIVCIGDSMTYGVAARARDSFPAVLTELRKEKVYNMGLGGYGPLHYLHLLKTEALELKPKKVVVSLFFGNDFMDVYNLVHYNANWRSYGPQALKGADQAPAFIIPRHEGKFLAGLRDWLARKSLIYAVVTRSTVFDFVRKRDSLARADASSALIWYSDPNHRVMFDLDPRYRFLDLTDPRIQYAMDITEQALLEMKDEARRRGVKLLIALIPTKERVYSPLLRSAGFLERYPSLVTALDQESAAHQRLTAFLKRNGLSMVDTLPALQSAVASKDIYPVTDPHPNHLGYRVIAETVNRALDNLAD